LDFVEPLTAYNEAKSLILAEPRLRCAKQTEQLGFCSVQSRHRQYRRPGSPLNNHVRQTRSAGHNLKPCRDSGKQRQGWPASRYVSAIVGQPCFDLTTRPPLTKHNGTAPIQADDVKRVLADIDAGYRDCRMSFSDMACSFVSLEAPLASFDRWRGRSTAGPSRSQTPS